MILNELNFNKIYCVNLKQRADRRQNMIDEFARIGLTGYEFFDAIDGGNLNLKSGVGFMTSGMVGCYMSHYLIIREAIQYGYESILVFEDDVKFITGASSFLDYAIPIIPPDWEFAYLGYTVYPKEVQNTVKLNAYWCVPGHRWGTQAYMIRGEGIKKVWKGLQEISHQIDVQLSYEVMKRQHVIFYGLNPACCRQNAEQFGSNVQKKKTI